MKNITKTIVFTLLIVGFAGVLFSQNKSNEYQKLLAKAQVLFAKQPEIFTNEDLIKLNELIDLDVNIFGEENARLCRNIVEQAKKKKIEYDQYIAMLDNIASALDTLDGEILRRESAETENINLLGENADLKQIIDDLKSIIARLEKQEKKLSDANARLEKETIKAKNLLKESSDITAQILMLMPDIRMDSLAENTISKTLRDSLEDAQCRVVLLLKSNFLITIQQLKANKEFMDSANAYYKLNNHHLFEVREYKENGEELIQRLKKADIDCAIRCANDIALELEDFIYNIETQNDNTNNFIKFVKSNAYWLVPVILILLIGLIILIRNTNKK